MTLAEFLLARLAEDEHAAIRVGTMPREWYYDEHVQPERWVTRRTGFEMQARVIETEHPRRKPQTILTLGPELFTEALGEHLARYGPARVLAEVKSKRAIIAEHTVTQTMESEGRTDTITWCPSCRNDGECPTLRLLALPYASHEDYKQEWKP